MTTYEVVVRALNARNTLLCARKQACSEIDTKIRALDEVIARGSSTQALNEPELFTPDSLLNPEIQRLITTPLAE